MDIDNVKVIFQWNKRDLDENMIPLAGVDEMETLLNSELQTKAFVSSAITGMNVMKTVKFIAKETVKNVIDNTAFKSMRITG